MYRTAMKISISIIKINYSIHFYQAGIHLEFSVREM